uniref:Cytochrome c biogenesis protein Ccs1 n=1 Tax=Polysiphonia infestans TaxID=2006978 RepID=A0A1Z1MEU9_9FLOR|nr:cytochrome c biogenesis protein ccs1 [Polysiphonia infestans]ARW64291.1 cytochrome c biogenesis protein ccs1 [Polysiphonia infestans]
MNNLNLKNLFWRFLKKSSNLNLSLFLLFMIIIACIMGSIIEQDQDFYYYTLNYLNYTSLIIFLGLNHVFRTWWFIFLLCSLGTALISCTFSNQLPSLKNARRWKFIYSQKTIDLSRYSRNNYNIFNYSYVNFTYSLIHSNFFVFSRINSIYAYKGLYGRIAPMFVHFSIIAILMGSMHGFFNSFVVQELVPVGEIFHLKNLVYSGFYSTVESNLFGHVDDFYIKYYNNGGVKQFFSKLSLYLNDDLPAKSQLMYVNRPLNFNNIIFYQTNWELNTLRFSIHETYFFQQKLFKKVDSGQAFWISNLQLTNDQEVLFVLTSLNEEVLICNNSGIILQEVVVGEKFYINSTPYRIESIITSTGLQIKYDPSISLVYFGFFTMIVTTFLSYLSYSQIWIYSSQSFLEFAGSTNRATLFFEQDIFFIDKMYSSYSYVYADNYDKYTYLLR